MQIEFFSPDAGLAPRTVLAIAVPEGEASSVNGGAFAAAVAAGRALATVAYFNSVLNWPYYRLASELQRNPSFALVNDSGRGGQGAGHAAGPA